LIPFTTINNHIKSLTYEIEIDPRRSVANKKIIPLKGINLDSVRHGKSISNCRSDPKLAILDAAAVEERRKRDF